MCWMLPICQFPSCVLLPLLGTIACYSEHTCRNPACFLGPLVLNSFGQQEFLLFPSTRNLNETLFCIRKPVFMFLQSSFQHSWKRFIFVQFAYFNVHQYSPQVISKIQISQPLVLAYFKKLSSDTYALQLLVFLIKFMAFSLLCALHDQSLQLGCLSLLLSPVNIEYSQAEFSIKLCQPLPHLRKSVFLI